MKPDDLATGTCATTQGEMVPFSAFATARWIYGSPRLVRFNGSPRVEIPARPRPGCRSGDAMAAMEELDRKLPPGIGYEWIGHLLRGARSGSQAPALYALSLLVVFLCLAALYESWSVPFAVMLVVPLGVLGAVLAATGRGLSNDVYFQVGLLATIGLSSKNAILIVEFAKAQMEQEGKELIDGDAGGGAHAAAPDPDDLARLRSSACCRWRSPPAPARAARTPSAPACSAAPSPAPLLGIFFVPLFYVVIMRLFKSKPQAADAASAATQQEAK